MATFDGGFSGRPFTLRLEVDLASQSILLNQSVVNWYLIVIKTANYTSHSSNANTWNVTVNGSGYSGNWTYDFGSVAIGGYITIASGSTTISHNSDGTKTISASSSANGAVGGGLLGTASNGGSMGLPTIPRASTPTFEQPSGTSVLSADAGTTVTVNMNRADSSFTHDITYVIGSSSGTIGTGVGASTTWAIPTSLMNEIPSSTSGVITINTTTYNGATTVGTSSTSFNMTVPTTAVPAITSVTNSEATTSPVNVATTVGAYVQGLSTLALAITGSAGVYSSTISSYKITVAGQTINAISGTTTPISSSGTVAIVGTVTDSRGRTNSVTVNVTVLAYVPPTITSAVFRRALSTGVLDESGTYLRVDLNAAVQSLIVSSTQKNDLTYKIYTRLRGDVSYTLAKTVDAGAITFNSYDSVGTYAIENSWDIRVDVLDKFNTASSGSSVATAAIFMHWGTGLAVGKFWEQGNLDVQGQIYQNDGKAVIDATNAASTTAQGIAELATNAESLTMTDTGRVLTPDDLKYVRDQGGFDTRYYTETEIDTFLSQTWQPVVPTSISSSGATATLNTTTGVVTCLPSTTAVQLNGIITSPGTYEYWVKLDLLVQPGNSTDYSLLLRMVEGTTPLASAAYNASGVYAQYNGVWGVYNASGTTYMPIGAVSGVGVYVQYACDLRLLKNPGSNTAYFAQFESATGGSDRTVKAGGYTPAATTAFTGIQILGTTAGFLFQGTIQVFRRKRMS